MPFTNLILMMTDLSPAAQAVLKAYYSTDDDLAAPALAAALRAAADQVVPPFVVRPFTRPGLIKLNIRNRLQSLADELEGRNEATL
jgi:hypothetical protein